MNSKDISRYPSVSIVLPVRNEQMYIEKCMHQLLHQDYPKEKYEILVVDGMSDDRTREIVTRSSGIINSKYRLTVRLLDNPKRYRAPAMNIGIRESRGEIILRIDARTMIPEDYLGKCVRTLVETGADNVGGVLKPVWNNSTQEAVGLAMSTPFGVGDAKFRTGGKSGYVDTVYLGCFRRDVFDKVGLFDETFPIISEDSDMNQRIRDAGGKVYLNKDIVANYYPRDNLSDLWKLYFHYGRAKAGNLIKYKKPTALRQIVPPLFLISIISLSLLGLFNRYFFYLLALLLGIYLLADVLVSIYLTVQSRKFALLPRLLVIFPIMHFSWTFGLLTRLMKRVKSWEY